MSTDQDHANQFLKRLQGKAITRADVERKKQDNAERAQRQSQGPRHYELTSEFTGPPDLTPRRRGQLSQAVFQQKHKYHLNRRNPMTQSEAVHDRPEDKSPTRLDRLAAMTVNEEFRATNAILGRNRENYPPIAHPHVSDGKSNHAARTRINNYVRVHPKVSRKLDHDRSMGTEWLRQIRGVPAPKKTPKRKGGNP